jgi:hypothetical protein
LISLEQDHKLICQGEKGMSSFLDFMERATAGPIISEDEFNMGVLIPNVMKTVKMYGIEYDPGNPVPSDDGFANRLFEGAVEFLA